MLVLVDEDSEGVCRVWPVVCHENMGTGVNRVSHVRHNYKSDDEDESRIGAILTTRNDRIVFFVSFTFYNW